VGSRPTFYLGQTEALHSVSKVNLRHFYINEMRAKRLEQTVWVVRAENSDLRQAVWGCRGIGMMAVKLDEIRKAAERVAASHGLDVVDIEFAGSTKDRILRVTLEKNAAGRAELKVAAAGGAAGLPEKLLEGSLMVEQLSGMTHEDCAAFSRDFGVLLDVEELVPGAAYTLEASSPGLDRKLSRPDEFERFQGCLVKVRTFEPVRNNRHWQGRLVAADFEVSASRPGAPSIVLDLAAVKQNSKSRKAGINTVEIALSNIEKANLVPEI
jgi:ribosome maturation factor RimP